MEPEFRVFRLAIRMTDSALAEHHPDELATCLERVTAQIRLGAMQGGVFDTNGNNVGKWQIERTPEDARQRIIVQEDRAKFAAFLDSLLIDDNPPKFFTGDTSPVREDGGGRSA